MTPIQDRVRAEASQAPLPGSEQSLAAAGVLEHVHVEDGTAKVELDTTTLGTDQVNQLSDRLGATLEALDGVNDVQIRHAGLCSPTEAGVQLPTVDTVLLVASSKGGVGKTTVATALARELSRHGDVGLFDADLQGPDASRALSAEGPLPAAEDGRPEPVDADGIEVVSSGLIEADKPLAWRGSVLHDGVRDLLGDTHWGDLDVLVIDAPPGTGDVMLTLTQSVPIDGALLVTTPHTDARSGIARTADVLVEESIPILGTVENMATFECPDCNTTHDLHDPGSTDEDRDLSPLARLPYDPGADWAGHPEIRSLSQAVRSHLFSEDRADSLDLRDVPAPACTQIAVEEASRLAPGEGLAITLRSDPSAIVEALQNGGLHVTRRTLAPRLESIEARNPEPAPKKTPSDPGRA